MYRITEKVTGRVCGKAVTGLRCLVDFFLVKLAITVIYPSLIYDDIPLPMPVLIGLILAVVDLVYNLVLFFMPSLTAGRYREFWALPTLATSLGILAITSSYSESVDEKIELLFYLPVGFFNVVQITFYTLRYIGLAWHDENCLLRRIFGMHRIDEKAAFAPMPMGPSFRPSAPMPMPINVISRPPNPT